MKRIFFAILVMACFIKSHESLGQITGIYSKNGTDLTLIRVNGDNNYDTLETVQVKDGRFLFSYVPTETGIYYLHFGELKWSLPLLLENTKTEIAIPNLKAIQISGGYLQDELSEWKKQQKKLTEKWLELDNQIQITSNEVAKEKLKGKRKKLIAEIDELENRYIMANSDNLLSVFLIWQKGNINFLDLDYKYNLLSDSMKESTFGREFKKNIEKKWHMTPGVVVPDFAIQDTSGVVRHLSDFGGKVKLLDFWASWCVPCRAANKRFVELYKKYNSQGLEIISISVDTKAEQWKKAIVKDGMEWTQLSQLELKASSLYYQYKLNGVPTWILLDKNNKCIALGHSDEKLETLIQNELKSR